MKIVFFLFFEILGYTIALKQFFSSIEKCKNEHQIEYHKCEKYDKCSKCTSNAACGWCQVSDTCVPISIINNKLTSICVYDCDKFVPLTQCASYNIGNNKKEIIEIADNTPQYTYNELKEEFIRGLRRNKAIIRGGDTQSKRFANELVDLANEIFVKEMKDVPVDNYINSDKNFYDRLIVVKSEKEKEKEKMEQFKLEDLKKDYGMTFDKPQY